jgi:hypothetical protein
MAASRSAAEHLADIALKIAGKPRSAGEYEKQKTAAEEKAKKSYSGAGDAARKREAERQSGI